MDKNKTLFVSKSIKRAWAICSQIPNFTNLSYEEIEERLEELDHLSNHDGVIESIIEHKYHESLQNIMIHFRSDIQRKIIYFLSKIIKSANDFNKVFISNLVQSICEIINKGTDNLTHEMSLGFITDIFKDSFKKILSNETQRALLNCFIDSIKWDNQNIIYCTLCLLSIGADDETIVSAFLLNNVSFLAARLKAGTITEKLGNLICQLYLKYLDVIELNSSAVSILDSNFDEVLIKILFQSHLTISAEYYLIVIKLLSKFLFLKYQSSNPKIERKVFTNDTITTYRHVIILFLLETLRRYNVQQISIYGLQIFYLTLTISKTLNNVLNESDQESWINFILEILRNNLSCSDTIIWSSRVLHRMIILNTNLVNMLENRKDTNEIAIESVVIQIFYTQNALTPISFRYSCELLTALAIYSGKMQNRFLESQTYTIIHMLVVKYFQTKTLMPDLQVEIRKAAGNALRSLILFNLSAKELFYNEDIQYQEAKRFIMNITVHKRQCRQYEEALAVNILFLASLAQYDPIKYDLLLGEMFDIKYILSFLTCSNNASIIEAIQELLIVFSGQESEIENLLRLCSIECWCTLANRFTHIYSIQKNTMIFLQLNSFQIKKVEQSIVLSAIANFISRSTKQYNTSLVIKFEASVLIQILIKQYPDFAKICLDRDLDIFLFETINMNSNEDLVMVALQAFYVLTEYNETRELISTKAVNQSNLRLLQCMIDIGTDLSNISNDLLLSAVKQKNECLGYSMISHLLNTGSRPNKYIINQCFEINNYFAASLLIRYYGIHESDKGHLINWSGLGMKIFQVAWIAKLSQELEVEIDGNIKWLSKRIKQESKNRMLLREHYEQSQRNQTKLLRYPTSKTRTLERKIGGYVYYTLNQDPIVPRKSLHDQKMDQYGSLKNLKFNPLDNGQDCSLPIVNKNLLFVKNTMSSDYLKSGEFMTIGRANRQENNKFFYKVIPGELNEFLFGFRCATDFAYHPLDPRCLLREGSKNPRDSKVQIYSSNLIETDLNFYIKVSSNKNVEFILPERSRDTICSDITSDTKDNINQVSHLDLSKNELCDLNEFGDIPKDLKLISLFKNITKLKLEKNSIKSISGNTFQVMESLEHLNLSENYLTEIPWHIFKFCPLVHLNLSRNKIKHFNLSFDMAENLKSYGKSRYLLQLILSDNCFKQFNIYSLAIFVNLQSLEINSIAINITKDDVLPLSNLKKISMKYNTLSTVHENFLNKSKNIGSINFSENQLKPIENTLEINLATFEDLVSVDLSHNNLACGKPFFVPKCILKIPKLQNLDLSFNNIREFPPCAMWISTCLTELNLSHNAIQNFDLLNAKTSFQYLQHLDLSYNNLKRIPPEIGYLNKLTYLNISHNINLKSLPDEIGLLKDKNLNSLIREGLDLNFPKYFTNSTHLRDILKYYYNRLKKSVEYKGLKLMVLGFAGRGKTSLLNSLQGKKNLKDQDSNTIGINVSSWKIQNNHMDKTNAYKFTCWDLAGSEEFFCTHECFLSRRALYLIVFDLTKEIEEIRILKPWLWNLKSQAPYSPLIIVGTHMDKLKESARRSQCEFMRSSIAKLCHTPGFPKISDVVFVDARGPNETINILRDRILNVLSTHRIHTEIMTQEKQPFCYLRLDEILQETVKMLPPAYPILTEKEMKELVSRNKLELDSDELKQAVQFLHDCGTLVHFDDTRMKLNDLYFLKPQWLCSMMAKTINMKTINPFIFNGVIKLANFLPSFRKTLDTPLPNHVTIENHSSQCFRILEKFDIVFRRSSDEIIIPSRLPKQRPNSIKIDNDVQKIIRIFEFKFLPAGFWPRLITRFSVLAKSFDDMLKISMQNLTLWRTGLIMSFGDSIYLMLEGKPGVKNDTEIIEVSVTKSEFGIKILVQIVDCIEVLIDEWYPGLADTDFYGNPIMKSYALCTDCHLNIDLLDIIQQSKESDQITCKNCSRIHGKTTQIPIRIIAPDIVLGDLQPHLIINPDLLEVNKCQESCIGSGGNGSVYKGVYMGVDCAVKYINNIDYVNDPPSYRLLRQEIAVLIRIQHPSLIKLLGVDLERIVLELAPLRDLKYILSNYILPRKLLQRISYQVIDGIEYLHQNDIMYRDIKMQNVLVFSIELSASINIKLADYGIARSVAPFGFINPHGTPGYQAPEVITKSVSYGLSADIFSFGILLYNIATRGHHPADMKTHWRAGKQPELISAYRSDNWPRMQDCINKCTKLVPGDRPKASEIIKFIGCPSFIAVKNVWPLTKQTRVECMVTKLNEDKKIEVFIANGNQFIQEVRVLDVMTGQSKGKPFSKDAKSNRILSMLLFGDFIFLGSQNGQLCAYNYLENDFLYTSAYFKDAILCMVLVNAGENYKILILGLANGSIYHRVRFTFTSDLESCDFNEIHLADAPVTNLDYSNDQVFATCGSGIYKLSYSDSQFRTMKIVELDENPQMKLIKCLCLITENFKGVLVTSFYFTIRNESLIYNYDDQGNQLKPAIDCRELIKNKMMITDSSYSTRIMCLAVWSGDRYIAAGTGTGHLIIIDQKMDYIKILSVFRNPIVCMQQTKFGNNNLKSEKENDKMLTNPSRSVLDSLAANDDSSKICNHNSGLIIIGNDYKSIEGEDFDGATLVHLSDDLSNISRQLDKHINSRSNSM